MQERPKPEVSGFSLDSNITTALNTGASKNPASASGANSAQLPLDQILPTTGFGRESLAGRELSTGADLYSVLGEGTTQAADHDLEAGIVKNTGLSTLNSASKMADVPNPDLDHQALRMKINTPVMQDGWNNEFVMKVRSMSSIGEQQASLHLNPSELGSIEITMTTEGDKAKVHFVVQTVGAREALENSLPKLREFFEESGLTLSDTGVEDQSGRAGLTGQQDNNPSNLQADAADESEETSAGQSRPEDRTVTNGRLDNVIDYYI